ncbi:MAG TPA: S8 family peptidase [Pseudonocardiaceae bacterium]
MLAAPAGAPVVPGRYLVVLRDDASPRAASADTAHALTTRHGGTVVVAWQHAVNGFAARLTAGQAAALAKDPAVAWVEPDAVVRADDTQPSPPSWGLDRVDQRNLPLDNSFTYPTTASTVRAYVIDTGILTSHATFGGRATWGYNGIDGTNTDCNGHGTHVAGTVGGAEYGVAKAVRLVAVKVLDCDGFGTITSVVNGVNWVTANAVRPAVANMSLGGGANSTLDSAVTNSIASGISYAVSAGNTYGDACNNSPARAGAAITVAATDRNDVRPAWSSWGICTDIFAPGDGITSAWIGSDTATNTISGTSMASPHVAGAAALHLAANPGHNATQVHDAIVAASTPDKVGSPGTGSPNRLLHIGGAATNCRGMTWSVTAKEWGRDLTLVGNDFHTDAYRGDASCTRVLPVLCFLPAGQPLPPNLTPGPYSGWSGGYVRVTTPVAGSALTSRAAADARCSGQFGAGWRMAEHHDGGTGWGMWAYGDPQRMWVAINDQPSNPWNTTSGRAMTWTLLARQWNADVVDVGSDSKTNAYTGDTAVGTSLPVLCLRQDGRAVPPGVSPTFNNGWARGEVRLTAPVAGSGLTSRATADALCSGQFGAGWRMAEFHDGGGGWAYWAAGDIGRMWVAINNQPANPWNSV